MRGLLRESVKINHTNDIVSVQFGLWRINIPHGFVAQNSVFQSLLDRQLGYHEARRNEESTGLVDLMASQGCFYPHETKDAYPYAEINEIFTPVRMELYEKYYSHPLWVNLSNGSASKNELVGWLMYNYNISRVAGIVAARMAVYGAEQGWRGHFRMDAIEEYWHCDAFYYIDAANLKVPLEKCKEYLHLPASIAFEEHTLQLAEADPLAHLMIAFYQESTIAFKSGAEKFHEKVEAAYKLEGFFRPWLKHMSIDEEEDHAGGLGELFANTNTSLPRAKVIASLTNAWLGTFFLDKGLDQVLGLARTDDEIVLRLPPGVTDPQNDSMLSSHDAALKAMLLREAGTGGELAQAMTTAFDAALAAQRPAPIAQTDAAYLLTVLEDSAVRALGFSRQHDELMACGKLAHGLHKFHLQDAPLFPQSVWAVAVRNSLMEAANYPAKWVIQAVYLLHVVKALEAEPVFAKVDLPARFFRHEEYLNALQLSGPRMYEFIATTLAFREVLNAFLGDRTAVPDFSHYL